ncbi:TPA: hypothetical protein ACG0AB_003582, partial [Elizabethkingia anophelis]
MLIKFISFAHAKMVNKKNCCSGVEVVKMTKKNFKKSFVNREKVFIFALANLKQLTEEISE